MNRTPRAPTPPPAPSRRRGTILALLGAALVLIAFLAGRIGGDPPARAAHPAPLAAPDREDVLGSDAPSSRARRQVRAAAPADEALVAPAPSPAVSPTPPAASRARASPEVVARVTEDLGRQLEAARAGFTDRCVPKIRRGGPPAKVTFNVTFDASGREIARGISEDRRAPAPEMAACLRKLPIGSLEVPAPGAMVGVRTAMTFP